MRHAARLLGALCVALAFGCKDTAGNDGSDAATSDSTEGGGSSGSTTGDASPSICDVFDQDCGVGKKCLPAQVSHIAVVLEDDNPWCAPLAPARVGFAETCSVDFSAHQDTATSYDDCDEGLLCWGVGDDGIGHCDQLCTGSAQAPMCPDGYFCAMGNGLNGVVCVPHCDPLAQDCPYPTDGCVLLGDEWGCYPRDVDSIGTSGRPCSFPNDCAPSFACVDESDFSGCSNSFGGCCARLCDQSDAVADTTCAPDGPDFSCGTWLAEGDAPGGHDGLGICIP